MCIHGPTFTSDPFLRIRGYGPLSPVAMLSNVTATPEGRIVLFRMFKQVMTGINLKPYTWTGFGFLGSQCLIISA